MWWKNSYPTLGNKNMAGDMQNIDMTDPAGMTQGPGLAVLTNGTQAAAVTTLIKSILDKAVTADTTYATGGTELYKLSATAVTNAGDWPHTITGQTAIMGEDVAHFNSKLYYSYNYTGGGDIGRHDLSSTFNDDWGSTVPATGATALQAGVPHQFAQTAEFLYTTNKQYITKYDVTNDIMTEQGLDLPGNAEAQSHVINNNRLIISANEPDLAGSNKVKGSIYKWDRNSSSWDPDSIFGLGRVGALYIKDGITFVFHQDISSTGGYHLGYINGTQVKNIANFIGSLPGFNQVTEVEGFLVWESSGLLYAWGSGSNTLDARLFQYMDGGLTTVGGIAVPFGTLLAASNATTSYQLAKASGYTVSSNWKSILYDVSAGIRNRGFINKLVVNFNTLAANSRVDVTLRCNLGDSTWGGTTTGRISHTGDGAVMQKTFYPKKMAKNFRLEFDYSNGNATNDIKITSALIGGHTL